MDAWVGLAELCKRKRAFLESHPSAGDQTRRAPRIGCFLLNPVPLPSFSPLLQLAKEGLSRVVVDDNADEQRTFSK